MKKLREDRGLFNKWMGELNINAEDDKTMSMLRQEIIDRLSSVYSHEADMDMGVNSVPISLTHEVTQFTDGKTKQTLNKICERYLINSAQTLAHIVQVIVTNKSLGETKQWKIRTKNRMSEFENIDVDVLSSDAKSDYHNVDKFISKIMMAKTKDELPNILIVCFHKARINDILTLFQMFCGNTVMMQNVKLKFHLSFDEPDANLGLCSKFLKAYKSYLVVLIGIEFITASPFEQFWKMLKENGIFQLINPHSQRHLEAPPLDETTYEEYLENYFQIKEHTHLRCDHQTQNPLEYIEHVFASTYLSDPEPVGEGELGDQELGEKIEKPYIDMSDPARKIVFSPAHLCTEKEGVGSHEEVVQFYIDMGWHAFLSNGKFKGFIGPDGTRTSVDDFNQAHGIAGELRDTLRKWAEIHPSENIAITGYWTIERGITFQTDGFNFTHAIVSDYHKQLLNKLVQLFGRLTGNKQYISQRCNIICPQHIMDTVSSLVSKTIELRKENPENYNATDFSDKHSCIPVKLTFVNEEYRLLCVEAITGRRNYKSHLHILLKNGYLAGHITMEDRNNVNVFSKTLKEGPEPYDDIHKSISNVKMYSLEDTSPQSRRFAQFHNAFNTFKPTAQTGEADQYSIDLAKDRYEYNGFVHDVSIAWVTFNHE